VSSLFTVDAVATPTDLVPKQSVNSDAWVGNVIIDNRFLAL